MFIAVRTGLTTSNLIFDIQYVVKPSLKKAPDFAPI